MWKFQCFCVLLSLGLSLSLTSARPGKDAKWDFLCLSHFWPPTSCYVFFNHLCSGIPKSVKGWTIHGLWPSIYHNPSAPFYCNDSAKFDYNKIKSLETDLNANWYNFDTPEGETGLWKHEWTKHGTCAENLPALRGELKYFNKTLQLHKNINILGALEKRNIVPSTSTHYKAVQFLDAIQAELKVRPGIVCWQSSHGVSYIDQIYLCFSKSFVPQDCVGTSGFTARRGGRATIGNGVNDSPYSQCREEGNTQVFFLPMQKTPETPPQHTRPVKSRDERVIYFKSEMEETVEWTGN